MSLKSRLVLFPSSWLRPPSGLVAHPIGRGAAVALTGFRRHDSRRTPHDILGQESEQVRLAHHSGRGRAESHLQRTLCPRAPPSVFGQSRDLAVRAPEAGLLHRLACLHASDPLLRLPPAQRREISPPGAARLSRILPPHPLPAHPLRLV